MAKKALIGKYSKNMKELDEIYKIIENIRKRTGSFICKGEVEKKLLSLTVKLLRDESFNETIKSLLSEFKMNPNDNYIFRSSLTSKYEPKSMNSVFMPRDQERTQIFLPYIAYSMIKLYKNFMQSDVQDDLRRMGYDPRDVGISPMIQNVVGARDKSGAIGRERTISFSAYISVKENNYSLNLCFGLPILATRPILNNIYQSVNIFMEGVAEDEINNIRKENIKLLDNNEGGEYGVSPNAYPQTHKAVLIPESGITYEQITPNDVEILKEFRLPCSETSYLLPLTYEEVKMLMQMFFNIKNNLRTKLESEKFWRFDGLVMRRQEDCMLEKPVMVGFAPFEKFGFETNCDEIRTS